jgi:hypothetical protein
MNRSTPSARFRPTLDALEARDNPASSFTASGAAAGGSPLVEVTRADGSVLAQFLAFEPGFTGGVRAAAGELDGNVNTVEVVAAAGPGGGPRIRIFSVNVSTGAVTTIDDEFVFEPTFRDGVRVAVGRIGGGLLDTIVLGTDPGGGPRVRTLHLNFNGPTPTLVPAGGPLSDFFAFEPSFRGGVRVAAGDVDGNPSNGDELVVGAGVGGGPRVIAFRSDGSVVTDFFAFPPDVTTGVNVSVVNGQIVTDGLATDVTQRNAALNAAAGVGLTAATTTALDAAAVAAANAAAAAAASSAFVSPTTAQPLLSGNPAPGFGFNLPNSAPGLTFSSPATAGVLTTPTGTFATTGFTSGVFNSFSNMPIGTSITAGPVFSTVGGAGVTGF